MLRLFWFFMLLASVCSMQALAEYKLEYDRHKNAALKELKSAEVFEDLYLGNSQWDEAWTDEYFDSHFAYFPFVVEAVGYNPKTEDKVDQRFSVCYLTTRDFKNIPKASTAYVLDEVAAASAFFLWQTNAWDEGNFAPGETVDEILASYRFRRFQRFSPRIASQLVDRKYHCDAYFAEIDAAKIFVDHYLRNEQVIARNSENYDWATLEDGIQFIPKDAFFEASAALFGFEDHNHRTAYRAGYTSYAEMQAAEAQKAAELRAAEVERGRLVAAGNAELLNFHTNLKSRFVSLKQEIEKTFNNRRPYADNSGLFGNFFGPDDSLFSKEPTAERLSDLDNAARAILLNIFVPELHKDQEITFFGSDDLQSSEAQFADLVCKWNLVGEYEKRLFSNYHMFSGINASYQPIDAVKDYQIHFCTKDMIQFVETNTMIDFYVHRGKFPKEMELTEGSSMIIPDYLFDSAIRNRRDTEKNDLVGDRIVNSSRENILIPIGTENNLGMLYGPPRRFVPSSHSGLIRIDDEKKCGRLFESLKDVNPFFSPIRSCNMQDNFILMANKNDSYFSIGFDLLSDGKRYLNYGWGFWVNELSNTLNELLDGQQVEGKFQPHGEAKYSEESWVLFADPFRAKKRDEFDRLKQIPGSFFISHILLTYEPMFDGNDVKLNTQLNFFGTIASMYGDGGGGVLTLEGKEAEPFIEFMMEKAN